MDRETIIEEINELISENQRLILPSKKSSSYVGVSDYVDRSIYDGWHTKALDFLRRFLSDDSDYVKKFNSCSKNTFRNAESANSILNNLIDSIDKGIIPIHSPNLFDCGDELDNLFYSFHRVVRQLRQRYNNRPTLDINDEYDVQDLLHALLKIYYDDIRTEEWTPSYSGKSARMDFLLKKNKTIIEVKKTRKGLTEKEIGDQLIVDIERYQIHPDCQRIVCFIYDPEGRIANPQGLKDDLMSKHSDFLSVYINPYD
jgi:hypothetical protein